MALHGKTTIQLFDAESGILTDAVDSENIVTNAVSNVLNGALNAVLACHFNGKGRHYSLDDLYSLPSGSNIAKSLFGGVLIFSKSISESAEHCIPTIDEMKSFIGCANQGSSVVGNIFKGSLNSAESEIGDNYVKFVWDFTTEQCNGDIACICLTSNVGGSQGYGFSAITASSEAHTLDFIHKGMWDLTDSTEYSSSYTHNPMFLSSFTKGNPHDYYLDGNNYYYVYRDKVYRYNIDRLMNKIGSNIKESFNYGAISGYDEVLTLSNSGTYIFKCLDNDKVYEMVTKNQDKETLSLIKVSGNGNSELIEIPLVNFIESLGVYFDVTYSGYNPITYYYLDSSVIYNDKIYVVVGIVNDSDQVTNPNKMRVYVLSFDGTFTFKDISLTDNMISMLFGTTACGGLKNNIDVSFNKILDTLVLGSKDAANGFKYYFMGDDGSISEYPFMSCKDNLAYYGYDIYKNSKWLKEPWCSFRFAGNGYMNTIELWAPYLATINNQSPVLTKTADKTMKIIYTLTQS